MKKRPDSLKTETISIKVGCGKMYVQISRKEEAYKEIYAWVGKTGTCSTCFLEALSTIITVAVNCKTPLELILKQLENEGQQIHCPQDSGFIPSCPVALARVMQRVWVEDGS